MSDKEKKRCPVYTARGLLADTAKVELNRATMDGFEASIANFTANPSDIRAWYNSQDPLEEVEQMTTIIGMTQGRPDLVQSVLDGYRHQNDLYEQAAASLVARVFLPEVFASEDKNPVQAINQLFDTEMPQEYIRHPQARLTVDDIVNFCLVTRRVKSYTKEDLENLYLAAEMFNRSSLITGKPDLIVLEDGSETTRQLLNAMISENIIAVITQQTEKAPNDLELTLLGLEAHQMRIAYLLGNTEALKVATLERVNIKKGLILSLVHKLEKVFVQHPKLLEQCKKGEYRGRLHELMWFLDSQMYLFMSGNNEVKVFPSHSFQDRPEVGHPNANRGYDFFIVNPRKHKHKLVQVKSKPQPRYAKEYHPLITPVYEQNFMDVDRKRMSLKIRTYTGYLQGTEAKQKASKYILPTVIEILGDFIKNGKNVFEVTAAQYAMVNDLPLNRHERRQAERELRKMQKRQSRFD